MNLFSAIVCYESHFLGNAAVLAVESNKDVILGRTTDLSVYVAGAPKIGSNQVRWRTPNGDVIGPESGPRIALHDANTRLVIQNVELEDSGTYHIEIFRECMPDVQSEVCSSTTINLNVQGTISFIGKRFTTQKKIILSSLFNYVWNAH